MLQFYEQDVIIKVIQLGLSLLTIVTGRYYMALNYNTLTTEELILEIRQLNQKFNLITGIGSNTYFTYELANDCMNFMVYSNSEKIVDKRICPFTEYLQSNSKNESEELSYIVEFISSFKSGLFDYEDNNSSRVFGGVRVYSTVISDEDGTPASVFGALVPEDSRQSGKTLEIVDKIVNLDDLTGLYNLKRFNEIASNLIKKNHEKQFAVVYSDINNFKFVNDAFGFLEGDRILKEFANTLLDDHDNMSVVGRINSDKFIALYPYTSSQKLKERVMAINHSFKRSQQEIMPTGNINIISGACIVNPYTGGVTAAIDNANIARKSIKAAGKTDFVLYNDYLESQIFKEMDITTNMVQALDDHEFRIFLQPKISFKDSTLIGAEALVRWFRADGTIVSPGEFIPVFEKNGFITSLDFYVYEEVCRLIRNWLDTGRKAVPISVNVSRVHILDPDFAEKFKAIIDAYKIPPELIELELTESIFLNTVDEAVWLMEQFKSYGFSISIDDFGSGYSSLNLLKELPADVIKIDKGFFRKDKLLEKDKIIVSSVVNLAKNLHMLVLCEGVETENQAHFLRSIDCDIAQGYLYSKPIPICDYEEKYSI